LGCGPVRHIFESLLTMEGGSWSGSWSRASSMHAKAQQASIVQAWVHVQVDVQVEVEVHDDQVAWVNDYVEKPQEWCEMKWKG